VITKMTMPATVAGAAAASREAFTPSMNIQISEWHSPVPYLFGGLAAMFGLVAFALLLLACSYWKISSIRADDDAKDDGDGFEARGPAAFEERVAVIMAGEVEPTFLAMP
ncbi:hypothetical protein M569_06552, partial [Genlisea aurea]